MNTRYEKWWGIAKAIGYELRPFPMPTKQDFIDAAITIKKNFLQLYGEGRRLAPEAWKMASRVKPSAALACAAWMNGWVLFIWLEFGAVYFIVSLIVAIFANLGERRHGEWSAYSVFNAGCTALLGTMNAEQFEREILHQNPVDPPAAVDVVPAGGVEPPRAPIDAAAVAEDERDYVFVDQPRDAQDGEGHNRNEDENMEIELFLEDDELDAGAGGDGVGDGDGDGAGVAGGREAGGGRKVSGKRARRRFEERRIRREEWRGLEAVAAAADADAGGRDW